MELGVRYHVQVSDAVLHPVSLLERSPCFFLFCILWCNKPDLPVVSSEMLPDLPRTDVCHVSDLPFVACFRPVRYSAFIVCGTAISVAPRFMTWAATISSV